MQGAFLFGRGEYMTAAKVNSSPIRTLMTRNNYARTAVKVPRRKPMYPMSAERELARDFLSVANVIKSVSKPYIKRLMAIYEVWANENVRTDARMTSQEAMGILLDEYGGAIDEGLDIEKIRDKVSGTAKYAKGISIRDWKALVNDALGADIDEPFYTEKMEDLVNKWAYESTQKITSYPQEYISKIQEVINWGFSTGQPMVNVYRKLEKITGGTRVQVRALARDQMGTLNYELTRYEHETMGVSQYKWVTKHDSRVRDCHRELDAHIFDWNNPPAQWYVTASRGIVYTGYAHPGQAIGCRCRAAPVFDEKKVESMRGIAFH